MPAKSLSQAPQALSLFLDDSLSREERPDDQSRARGGRSYLYENPLAVIRVDHPDDLERGFTEMERALAAGHHLAGWIGYEAGLALEDRLKPHLPSRAGEPYLYFGVFAGRRSFSPREAEQYWRAQEADGGAGVRHIRLSKTKDAYLADIARIKDWLAAGDIYQVNYTLGAEFDYAGDSRAIYAALRRAQRVAFGAFIRTPERDILSFSPELFLRRDGSRLTTRPMKGTLRRGRTVAEDDRLARWLQGDEKNRAENLMIVDLLRNDLSKIARPGSVAVESLYDVEKYATLFQMTSTITATVDPALPNTEILKAMFPCGSVTGAPKIRAMEIIAALENGPRGLYTGALGYLTPQGDMCFNVPIRTLSLDRTGHGRMGVGSGIVADSDAEAEYEECRLKAAFLTRQAPDFALIETMRWTARDGIADWAAHLERLRESAAYFDFSCETEVIREELDRHCACLDPGEDWRLRLLLSRDGTTSMTATALPPDSPADSPAPPRRVILSDRSTDSRDVFLYHKTTMRKFYDRTLRKARRKRGCFEVLFTNETGDLTEGSFTNLFVEKAGRLYTPPAGAGLLSGILRQKLLREGRVRERRLRPGDLTTADRIYVGNSLRGLIPVRFESGPV